MGWAGDECPHSGDLQEERGLEARCQNQGLETRPKLQLPGSPISQTCHISPCLSPACTDVRSSQAASGQETRQKLGIRECSGAAGGTGFDLQEKLGHTPMVPWLSALPQRSLALRDTS